MTALITYRTPNVFDIFIKNIESFVANCENIPNRLVILSNYELPKSDRLRLVSLFSSVVVFPLMSTVKFDSSNYYETSPYAIQAISMAAYSSYVYVDPFLFFVNPFTLTEKTNEFFVEDDGIISTKLFSIVEPDKFKIFSEFIRQQQFDQITSRTVLGQGLSLNSIITKKLEKNRPIAKGKNLINQTAHTQVDTSSLLAIDMNCVYGSKYSNLSTQIEMTHKVKTLILVKRKEALIKNQKTDPQSVSTSMLFTERVPADVPIKIIHPKQVYLQAHKLKDTLMSLGFNVNIEMIEPGSRLDSNNQSLHIIMCCNVYHNYPKSYIAYQFEQAHSGWFTNDYFSILNNSIEIWEYSEYNISYFEGRFTKPHIFVPISSINPPLAELSQNRDIDVLFYGEHVRSNRRREFLDSLSKLRQITIIDGITNHKFGNDIISLLKRAKVIVNHHYYDNGNLEVVRVYEALSYGCKVVSEVSVDDNRHDLPISKYSTVTEANSLIESALADPNIYEFDRSNKEYVKSALSRLGFNLHKRIAVFAHYDKLNQIDQYVVDYLTELKKYCDKIIFVSDSDLSDSELHKINHLISDSICKKHGEANDLGSYKRGFFLVKDKYQSQLSDIDQFLFVNDSSYCVSSLSHLFAKMSSSQFDAWAVCDHHSDPKLIPNKCYLQSNFLCFNREVFLSVPFENFMHSIVAVSNKWEIVDKYELGLSEMLIKNNFSTGCYISYKTIANYVRDSAGDLTNEILSILSTSYPNVNNSIMDRVLSPMIGGDYVYSDHFYTLLKIGSPLVKCLALVPNEQTGPNNKLIDYWQPLLIHKLGSNKVNLMLNHISRIGKFPKSPKNNTKHVLTITV